MPAKFSDLTKKFKDLSKDDFGFGEAKLTLKSKTANGINLKAEESRKFSDGSVSGLLEVKYTNAAHGLTIKDTWNTKNVIDTEIVLDNKSLQGNKFTLNKSLNTGSSLFSNWSLKHEFGNKHLQTETKFNGKEASGNVVVSVNEFNFGLSGAYLVKDAKLKEHTALASYTTSDSVFTAAITNATNVEATVFHSATANTSVGVQITFNTSTSENAFNVVAKHQVDKDSFVKASLDKKFSFGLAYTQALREGVKLTLSAKTDAANLAADTSSLGLALTFEN